MLCRQVFWSVGKIWQINCQKFQASLDIESDGWIDRQRTDWDGPTDGWWKVCEISKRNHVKILGEFSKWMKGQNVVVIARDTPSRVIWKVKFEGSSNIYTLTFNLSISFLQKFMSLTSQKRRCQFLFLFLHRWHEFVIVERDLEFGLQRFRNFKK